MKKICIGFAFVFLLCLPLFAGGKKDTDERSVENLDSWKEDFDIAEKKPGKYNIVVSASDKGGNTEVIGPYNLYIDPDSDLPVTGITNPVLGQRVPGNLNIVGTCIDDDAVERVEIIFDGDTENPVIAEGSDFWSYYLDTSELEEGFHTIEVCGYDENGLKGKSLKSSWQLDRKMPQSQVTSHSIGQLVSGTMYLKGTVFDGNGIKLLEYSLDNGKNFEKLKLKYDKKNELWNFDIRIKTKDMKDGPAVCWLRSEDLQSTVGLYSFLFFVDNTAPEIQFVYPRDGESVNGEFSIAGAARDIIGVTSLSWKCGNETGEFELSPGNPYWTKSFDSYTLGGKDCTVSIFAKDKAGNVTEVKRRIPFDFEADKPKVLIDMPQEKALIDDNLFLRGIAFDDDGISSIRYSLDNEEEKTIPSNGVFSQKVIPSTEILTAGTHTLSVIAIDRYGKESEKKEISFLAMGLKPVFSEIYIKKSQSNEKIPYEYGMDLNPEDNPTLFVSVISESGLLEANSKVGTSDIVSVSSEKPKKAMTLSVPLFDSSWGIIPVELHAVDVYNRKSSKVLAFSLKNLSRLKGSPAVVFSDSTCTANIVDFLDNPIVSGYFIGGNAKKVELVPPSEYVNAHLEGNSIVLTPGSQIGTSESFIVRVTNEKGISYDSKKLRAKTDSPFPVINVLQKRILDGSEACSVTGTIKSSVPLKQSVYRVLSSSDSATVPFKFLSVKKDTGAFKIDFSANELPEGIHVIEIVAETLEGKKTVDSAFIENLAPLESVGEGENVPSLDKPVFEWIDGLNLYYTLAYKGFSSNISVTSSTSELKGLFFEQAGCIQKEELIPGENKISVSVDCDGKPVKTSYIYQKDIVSKLRIESVNDKKYTSLMNIEIPKETDDSFTLKARLFSSSPVAKISASINDISYPAKFSPATDGEGGIIISIPLNNVAPGIANLALSVELSKSDPVFVHGTIGIVRPTPLSGIDDKEKIYWYNETALKNSNDDRLRIKKGDVYKCYANILNPSSVRFQPPVVGLRSSINGNVIHVEALEDGYYGDISLVVTDVEGSEYEVSLPSNHVNSIPPIISLLEPVNGDWVQNDLKLSVSVRDVNGIEKVFASIDHGENWIVLEHGEDDLFFGNMPLSLLEDGLVSLSLKAVDSDGFKSIKEFCLYKDSVKPTVSVILPLEGDTVNGETTIVFKCEDAGVLEKVESIPHEENETKIKREIPFEPVVQDRAGTSSRLLRKDIEYLISDAAGNVTSLKEYGFSVDNESDLPVVEIHVPLQNSVISSDFEVSGVIYDDDGPCKIWYSLDDGEFNALEGFANSYAIKVPLSVLTDNEHYISVYAEDIHGVKGETKALPFRVSLDEPKATVLSPEIGITQKEECTITGTADDKNGIKKVEISVDNGNTFNNAVGESKWSYSFDTRLFADGTHVVFVRVTDNYDITSLYSSLVNIDNEKPDLQLELPLDGSLSTGKVFFSGRTMDNIGITNLSLSIKSLGSDNAFVSDKLSLIQLDPDDIITQVIDISELDDGFYNVELTGSDAGGNISRISRNIQLDTSKPATKVDLMYPLNGENVQGKFNVHGLAVSQHKISKMFLYVDDVLTSETELSATGYYKFEMSPENLSSGSHSMFVKAFTMEGEMIPSNKHYFDYSATGAWISIDNFAMGDFAYNRPFIEGSAGYVYNERDVVILESKESTKAEKERVQKKSLDYVEISFDNGKTFKKVGSKEFWRFRVENEDMPEGYNFLVVKAVMKNGENAVTRSIIQIDKTAPSVRMVSPGEGGRYNQVLRFAGLASDEVGLENVMLQLRSGDKASYEVPGFIQGLYIDTHFLGATLFDIGLGLTFFDDNVKLQANYGQLTQSQFRVVSQSTESMRYGGHVFSGKLIANIGYLPFRYFLGPDWAWLSMTFGLGANFSYFTETQSGKGQFLSAVIAQIEFPRVTLPDQNFLSMFSFYTEGQLWFIPTDVASNIDINSVVPQISFGLRVNVF